MAKANTLRYLNKKEESFIKEAAWPSGQRVGGPGFESRSGHYLDLILGSPEFKSSATLVNSQLVCLWPAGILNNVMFNLNYLFQLFAPPH